MTYDEQAVAAAIAKAKYRLSSQDGRGAQAAEHRFPHACPCTQPRALALSLDFHTHAWLAIPRLRLHACSPTSTCQRLRLHACSPDLPLSGACMFDARCVMPTLNLPLQCFTAMLCCNAVLQCFAAMLCCNALLLASSRARRERKRERKREKERERERET